VISDPHAVDLGNLITTCRQLPTRDSPTSNWKETSTSATQYQIGQLNIFMSGAGVTCLNLDEDGVAASKNAQ
jgi:hypothetical protein